MVSICLLICESLTLPLGDLSKVSIDPPISPAIASTSRPP